MDLGIWIPIVAIVAWLTITLFGMFMRTRRREMEHRERLAMIERGLMPSPESDPRGFERSMGWEHSTGWDSWEGGGYKPLRVRRHGVQLMFIGMGVGLLLSFTVDGTGFGIGGLIALIGLGLFLSSFVGVNHASRRSDPYDADGHRHGRPPGAPPPAV